ncbi:methyltransferase domain-containing protein [Baekduia sp. Peel2402]|uniref:methyltransferase domain-containing protein n=1 Tax=Baekduia sp. Peel2402 TaxID=3458296 RepID=UPI00403ECD88
MEELAAAYEGLESDLGDADAIAAYRAAVLARQAAEAAFLAGVLPTGARVLEVGCGNGGLLIELARRGAVGAGLGLDLAQSRIAFAAAWAADEPRAAGLRFAAADALSADLGAGYDAVLCVTGAFAYFDGFRPGAGAELLARAAAAVAPGGRLVLELYQHERTRRLVEAGDGHVRLWRELEPGDPWRFYLSDFTFADGILEHRKTFIHRDDGTVDTGRSERLALYAPDELDALLDAAGFGDVTRYDGWDGAPYGGGDHLVLTAVRRAA